MNSNEATKPGPSASLRAIRAIAAAIILMLLATNPGGATMANQNSGGNRTKVVEFCEDVEVTDYQEMIERLQSGDSVSIAVPLDDEIQITGSPVKYRANDYWIETLPDGTTQKRPDPYHPFTVQLADAPLSQGSLLIAPSGLYGNIERHDALETVRYSFDVQYGEIDQVCQVVSRSVQPYVSELNAEELQGDVQVVASALAAAPSTDCAEVPAPPGCNWPCLVTQTFVQLDAEKGMESKYPDYGARVVAALTGHHGSYHMWKDICMELLASDTSPRLLSSNVGTSNAAGDVLSNYETRIFSGGAFVDGVDAYQLFTARDLTGDTLGIANTGQGLWKGQTFASLSAEKGFASQASSVVQDALDSTYSDGGSYGPEDPFDRARVGGHELSHVWSAQHASACRSSGCNIMEDEYWDGVDTWWRDWERCSVYRYYFHSGDAYGGAPEGCPNWYAP